MVTPRSSQSTRQVVPILAIEAPQVHLAVDRGDRDCIVVGQPVACRERQHEAFAKQRRHVEAFGKAFAGRHDGHVDLAGFEQRRQFAWHAFDQLQLDAFVAPVEVGQQPGEPARPDGAHDADFQMRVSQAQEARRFVAHAAQLVDNLLEPGSEQRAQIGDVRQVALAPEQQAAHFVLELLDGAAQRRLGHIALLRGPREVAGVADGQEVPDVMNVHSHT